MKTTTASPAEETPKHTKITTYTTAADGSSITATTDSYFEELSSRKTDIIRNIKTDHNNFLTDVMSCLDVINKQETKELNIRITVDEWNKPSLIIKRWTVLKEDFKRR